MYINDHGSEVPICECLRVMNFLETTRIVRSRMFLNARMCIKNI